MIFISCVGNFPRLIPVPTHFFKVVLAYHRKDNATSNNNMFGRITDKEMIAVGSFLIPNQKVDGKDKVSVALPAM